MMGVNNTSQHKKQDTELWGTAEWLDEWTNDTSKQDKTKKTGVKLSKK